MTDDPLLPEDRARLVRLLALMEPEHARDVAAHLGIDLCTEPTAGPGPREPTARGSQHADPAEPDGDPGSAREDPSGQDPSCLPPHGAEVLHVLRERP
ncbi:hypothetical protein [Nocardiopsis kunsanensis]|nr:hypothetical protein [Nocardiopsis kunsanensis]